MVGPFYNHRQTDLLPAWRGREARGEQSRRGEGDSGHLMPSSSAPVSKSTTPSPASIAMKGPRESSSITTAVLSYHVSSVRRGSWGGAEDSRGHRNHTNSLLAVPESPPATKGAGRWSLCLTRFSVRRGPPLFATPVRLQALNRGYAKLGALEGFKCSETVPCLLSSQEGHRRPVPRIAGIAREAPW